MKIYAIRHTSVALDPGLCYGQSDVEVAATFPNEKNDVADALEGLNFQKVYSSPLLRCRKLAEFIFAPETIEFDDRLKELDFGVWELQSWDEIYRSDEGKKWMNDYQNLPTLNGESYPEMKNRIKEWLDDVRRFAGGDVAVVAHAGVIRILKHLIEKQSMSELFVEFKPPYGSVSIFEVND